MRRIFLIEGRAHVSASVYPYAGTVHDRREWHGARGELLIVDCIDWDHDSRREGDVIEIEGDVDALRKMLTDALNMLDANLALNKERRHTEWARSLTCPTCGTFADPINNWHGDGKGHRCYGLAPERLRIVTEQVQQALET